MRSDNPKHKEYHHKHVTTDKFIKEGGFYKDRCKTDNVKINH